MKILRLCMKTPPLKGGMEKHIFFLSKEQVIQECNVTVAFNRGELINVNDIRNNKNNTKGHTKATTNQE